MYFASDNTVIVVKVTILSLKYTTVLVHTAGGSCFCSLLNVQMSFVGSFVIFMAYTNFKSSCMSDLPNHMVDHVRNLSRTKTHDSKKSPNSLTEKCWRQRGHEGNVTKGN